MSLRAVQGLQVAVSIYADRGLLDKSTVVRISLRRRPPQPGAVNVGPRSGIGRSVEFDEMLEFPSEQELASGGRAGEPAGYLKSMLRFSTFAAFAAGVAVGASSGRLDLSMPTLLTVTAPLLPTPVPLTGAAPAPAPPEVTLPARLTDVDDSNIVVGVYLTKVTMGMGEDRPADYFGAAASTNSTSTPSGSIANTNRPNAR